MRKAKPVTAYVSFQLDFKFLSDVVINPPSFSIMNRCKNPACALNFKSARSLNLHLRHFAACKRYLTNLCSLDSSSGDDSGSDAESFTNGQAGQVSDEELLEDQLAHILQSIGPGG